MRAIISGDVVDVESKPWEMNGNTGIAHAVYVRADTRGSAQRVKVTEVQIEGFEVGDQVDLPVDIFAQASNYGGAATLRCTLDPEVDPSEVKGRKSAPLAFAG